MHSKTCSPNVLCSIFRDGILGSSGHCVACLWTLQGDEPQWVMTVHAGCFITLNLLRHLGLALPDTKPVSFWPSGHSVYLEQTTHSLLHDDIQIIIGGNFDN